MESIRREKEKEQEIRNNTKEMISDDEDGFYMEEVVQLDDNEIYGSKKSEKKELK